MGSGSTKSSQQPALESRKSSQQGARTNVAAATPEKLNKASNEGQISTQVPHTADVFISYQWDKQRQVKALYDKLTGLGYSCWMDLEQMGGGDSLYDKIEEGITGCRVFLACVTEKYSVSENCRREVSVADGRKKTIILLKMDQSAWPPAGSMGMVFGPKLFINFCKPNEEVQEHWDCPQFQELIDRIGRSLNPHTDALPSSKLSKTAKKNALHKRKLKFTARLDLGENAVVTGVAFIDNKICVVCEDGDAPVKIFSCSPPYNELGEIPLEKVKDQVQVPQDLIACKDTGLLYVTTTVFRTYSRASFLGPWSNPYHGYVWSMHPNTAGQKRNSRQVISVEYGIAAISLRSLRLLITPCEPSKQLHVYHVSTGRLIKQIELVIAPNYGVETTQGTYLVCVKSNETPVIEVDSSGCSVETYNSGKVITDYQDFRFRFPGQIAHFVLDDVNDCLLVAEADDKRLIMLNNKLQFETVLLTKRQKVVSPVRVCYGPDMGLLALAGDNFVNIYTT